MQSVTLSASILRQRKIVLHIAPKVGVSTKTWHWRKNLALAQDTGTRYAQHTLHRHSSDTAPQTQTMTLITLTNGRYYSSFLISFGNQGQ